MMATPIIPLYRANGEPLRVGEQIDSDYDATIHLLVTDDLQVAKIYRRPEGEQEAKLRAMLANPPPFRGFQRGRTAIAWPTELLMFGDGGFAGYLKPRADEFGSVPFLEFCDPKERRRHGVAPTWRDLVRTASQLTEMFAALHFRSYVVGDLNVGNLVVREGSLVTLVDCDSIQVPGDDGKVYRCTPGTTSYMPLELYFHDLHTYERRPAQDNFSLAIFVFMLLMQGIHPYTGKRPEAMGSATAENNIRAGVCPYLSGSDSRFPDDALPLDILPSRIRMLMLECFGPGWSKPRFRPTTQHWKRALLEAEHDLTQCLANSRHWYGRHLFQCPWCERLSRGFPDIFAIAPAKAVIRPVELGSQRRLEGD